MDGHNPERTRADEGALHKGRNWLIPAVAFALLLVAYADTFQTLWRAWMHNPNYSHGFLIPPIALALVWLSRRRLARVPAAPSWGGLLLLGPAVLLHVVGVRGDVAMFQAHSFILVLAGLVWTWFGWAMLRAVSFPVAFLFFAAPTFPVIINRLSFALQSVAAFSAVRLAQALGAAVTREGPQGMDLYFPSGMLTVEGACSGLNSLIALLALGALFAYFSNCPLWRRWLLFFLSAPVALAANIVRITSLCVYAALTTAERAAGLFHDIGGFVLFAVALVVLGLLKEALRC